MSTTEYDSKSNVLKIVKDKGLNNQNSEQTSVIPSIPVSQNNTTETESKVETKKARGFILAVGNTEEDILEYQSGNPSKLQLAPVLAGSEEEAIELIRANGKLPATIFNYELLKVQVGLIEELAKNEGIELIELPLFNIQKN